MPRGKQENKFLPKVRKSHRASLHTVPKEGGGVNTWTKAHLEGAHDNEGGKNVWFQLNASLELRPFGDGPPSGVSGGVSHFLRNDLDLRA